CRIIIVSHVHYHLPNYVPGPKEPEQAPPLPKFVLEPIYLEFTPLEDEILPVEEQPLPVADSSTADSLRYIPGLILRRIQLIILSMEETMMSHSTMMRMTMMMILRRIGTRMRRRST
nr:hypothetical protein [Tanacetum cinerariifolium]